MQIQKAKIENFKGIICQEYEFQPGFNLIKGINGRGKTSILEGLAVGLGGFVMGIPEAAARNILVDEIHKSFSEVGDGSCDVHYSSPVSISIETMINGEQLAWTRSRISYKASKTSTTPRSVVHFAEDMAGNNAELPVILYESAGRVWMRKKKTSESFGKKFTRTIGYKEALSGATNTKLIRNWCMKMELTSFKQKKEILEYEAVKKVVEKFMQLMNNGNDRYQVFYDPQLEEIMISINDRVFAITDLSAGYQSLIWMVFDIACRMAILNPDKGSLISDTFGVVLIDEIDMHLHPSWQWNIVPALIGTFPNVQFIATTHSPILFASAKNVLVIDIDGENVTYGNSKYGIDLNSSINDFQATPEVTGKVKALTNAFHKCLDNQEYEKAETLLEAIIEEVGDNHPLVVDCRELLDLEKLDLGD